MVIEKVNIGLAIEAKLNELELSKSEFGRRIGIPQQNVNRILEKSSIDTDNLLVISEALGYNFFLEYVTVDNSNVIESKSVLNKSDVEVNEELIRLRAENDVLRELAGLRKKTGTLAV